jgi:Cu(I)/Ag(I) efflux system membrane fusion protein
MEFMNYLKISCATLLVLVCGATGCNSRGSDNVPAATTEHLTVADTNHTADELAKAKAVLAKLPPEEALAAEKQRICPVSEELLGSMGVPVKVALGDTVVWICCEGCRDKLTASPGPYLSRLKQE